jgi:hypothetical protein
MMVPAMPRDTIESFLSQLQTLFSTRNPSQAPIKCEALFVEDHYEVDPRFSVEECLGDMMRVVVTAKSQSPSSSQQKKPQPQAIIPPPQQVSAKYENGKKRPQPEQVVDHKA